MKTALIGGTTDQKSASSHFEMPRAVLFDAYGKLFDVYSVGQLAEQLFPGHGPALSVLWRGTQPTRTGSSLRDVLSFFPN